MQNTEQNLKKIRTTIQNFERYYQRVADSVQLMAVSKKKPADEIVLAYQCGQRIFGESYVQEALGKMQQLEYLDALSWHFIGPIQSNKTRDIARYFNWVHSVDRFKVMQRLNNQRTGKLPINICLQVNIDKEVTKSGFLADEVLDAAQQVMDLPHLTLRGLMAIPKPASEGVAQRRAFARVRQLYEQLQVRFDGIDTLSMGMSGDLEAAIAEGSTMVRVGTAIFGQR